MMASPRDARPFRPGVLAAVAGWAAVSRAWAARPASTLSTYGWGGYTWGGGVDAHGYGSCRQLRSDLVAHGANSYNFLLYDSAGADYLRAVECLGAFHTDPLVVGSVPLSAWITLIPPPETSVRGSPFPLPETRARRRLASPCVVHMSWYGLLRFAGSSNIAPHRTRTACPTLSPPPPLPARWARPPVAPLQLDQCVHNKSRACCSVPADSPLTDFNETALLNESMGYSGCHDHRAWATVVGRVAVQHPALKHLSVDDLVHDFVTFSPELVAAMRGLARPSARLTPVVYHPMLQAAARLPLGGI